MNMQIGRYDVIGRVAANSASTVWKAHDSVANRPVAIKRVLATPGGMDRDRLGHEARILSGLTDPNVVAFYELAEDADGTYVVTEWIDGPTLGAVIAGGAGLSEQQSVAAVRGALSGLAHAHQRGVVHGDVSPSNIIVNKAGESKILDFGLATTATGATAPGGAGGAAAYRSPEVERGEPPTPAADVYASAAVLAHLLRGTVERPPATTGVAEPIKSVLDRALSPLPGDRYPDAGAFLAALDDAAGRRFGAGWLGQAGLAGVAAATGASPLLAVTTTVVAEGAGQSAARSGLSVVRRRPRVFLGIAAGVVGVVAVSAIALASGSSNKKPSAAGGSSPSPTQSLASPSSTPTPTPTAVPPEKAFAGTYRLVSKVTVATYSADWHNARLKVGHTEVRYWKVTTTCNASGTCIAKRTSSSGSTASYKLTGKSWAQSVMGTGQCIDSTTGKTVATKYKYAVVVSLNPSGKGFTGRYGSTTSGIAPCSGTAHEVETWTVTPVDESQVPATAFPSPKTSPVPTATTATPPSSPASPTATPSHS